MKILIAGLGEVGSNIFYELYRMNTKLTVVDTSSDIISKIKILPGVKVYTGGILSRDILSEIEKENFDIFFAITGSDEVNMISCSLSHQNFTSYSICRTSHVFDENNDYVEMLSDIGIQRIVNPFQIITDSYLKLIQAPNLIDTDTIFDGEYHLLGFRISGKCVLLGWGGKEILETDFPENIQMLWIKRHEEITIPKKYSEIQLGDIIYFAAKGEIKDMIENTRKFLGYNKQKLRKVVINGGGNIGFRLASKLELLGFNPQIIEVDTARCRHLNSQLQKTTILNFDGTDQEIMKAERIGSADIFFSVTNSDSVNLISTKIAKDSGCGYVISLCREPAYVPVFEQSASHHLSLSPRLEMSKFLNKLFKSEILPMFNSSNNFYTITPLKGKAIQVIELSYHEYPNLKLSDLDIWIRKAILVFTVENGKIIVLIEKKIISKNRRLILVVDTGSHPAMNSMKSI